MITTKNLIKILLFFIMFSVLFSQKVEGQISIKDTTIANHYIKKGKLLKDEAKYDSSNVYYKKAIFIFRNVEDWEKVCFASKYLADNFLRKGEFDSALVIANSALKTSVTYLGKNHLATADAYSNIGNVYLMKNDIVRANEYYYKTYKIMRVTLDENNPKLIASYGNLAITYRIMGDLERAIEFLKKALKIAINKYGEEHLLIAKLYVELGNSYVYFGDYVQALEYSTKSYNIKKKLLNPNHPELAFGNMLQGLIYDNTSQYDKALSEYLIALQIYKDNFGENNVYVSQAYNNCGKMYSLNGDTKKALEYFKKSLKIKINLYDEKNKAVVEPYTNIAQILFELQKYDEAIHYYEKIKIIFQESNYRNPLNAYNFIQLGKVYIKKQEYIIALKYLQKSINILVENFSDSDIYKNPNLNKINSSIYLRDALEVKAFAFKQLYTKTNLLLDLETSFNTYQLSIELLDKMKKSYLSEEVKILWSENTQTAYKNAVETSLQLFEITQNQLYKEYAFNIAEKNKASGLLGLISDFRSKKISSLPDSLLNYEKELRIKLTYYDTQIQKEKVNKEKIDSVKYEEYQNILFKLNREYQSLINRFENEYPQYYNLKYQTKVADIKNIKNALEENSAMVEYFINDTSLVIYYITKNNFNVVKVPINSGFNILVKNLIKSLKEGEIDDFANLSDKLYDILISPISDDILSASKLIIIPDGILNNLPFEVLAKFNKNKYNLKENSYLISEHSLSYYPSATLLCNNKKTRYFENIEHKYFSYIGFAPVFSEKINNEIIISNSSRALDTLFYDNMLNSRGYFVSLPYSRKEIRKAYSFFKGKKVIYTYDKATEDNFLEEINNNYYDIVHIATHTFVNENNPKLSCIVFSQKKDSLLVEDGFLYASEVYNLSLHKTDLLVLSSCESGVGKIVKGEGMLSLTRGFLYAGARNIIYSLWKINDKFTNEFITLFYEGMSEKNLSYSSALREAKLKMINNGFFPGLWASFVLFEN